MLDGAARIKDIVAAASADRQPGLGITDHGNMYGVLDFYRACKEVGINPVLGTETYMAATSRSERPTRATLTQSAKRSTSSTPNAAAVDPDADPDAVEAGTKLFYHLTILAENNQGYHNLIRLSSEAFMTGYYRKPRVDWELLERYHHGLIATSGCLGGLVLQSLLHGNEPAALALAGRLQDIFGVESFFIELQDHGLIDQARTNPALIRIAKKLAAPLLATNDAHYTRRADATIHDALLCIQTNSLISDPKRFHFEGTEHYLKSAIEMRQLFSEIPEACDNTLLVASRAQVDITFGHPQLPEFPVPDSYTGPTYLARADKYLSDLTYQGARRRYGANLTADQTDRIDYELAIISQMGFSAYFLIVWDLILYANRSAIRVGPGRGSAAGSVVAYCLGIVAIDPLRYNLLFERFLNPGRAQMPDIDMDFDERYRSQMIEYVSEKYGRDHVAQIITFSTIKARAAVRDATRVLGQPYVLGDKISKALPRPVFGRDQSLSESLVAVAANHRNPNPSSSQSPDLYDIYRTDPQAAQVIDTASGLEGLRRQDGIHAAAVVITGSPLTDYLPIQRKPDANKDPSTAPVVTQYEMHGVEALGLLKMDFLGLRNLSVISRAVELIASTTGQTIDIDNVPLDDQATFAMLRAGDSIGVFQLESSPMRALMRSLAPTDFDDIAALIALYRPGPMAANMHNDYAARKNGLQPVEYLHPDMADILSDTYGLLIYQESVMLVAQAFAGYTLAQADNLRKAASKKDRALMDAERAKFVAGVLSSGYSSQLGHQLFDIIEPFADYAFNKSHSYGYGLIAYQTAWLKANYPVEYFAALLSSVKGDNDRTTLYLGECRVQGIDVLVPDINRSLADFTPAKHHGSNTPDCILFGISAIKNVGIGPTMELLKERDTNGPFTSFYDFAARVDSTVASKRVVEALIKTGAFDQFGTTRQGLMLSYPDIVSSAQKSKTRRDAGIISLFDAVLDFDTSQLEPQITIPNHEYPTPQLLSYEKEYLGLYLTAHPLADYLDVVAPKVTCTIADIRELDDQIDELSSDQPTTQQVRVQSPKFTTPALADAWVTVAGIVSGLNRRYTKKGDLMATFTLEDLYASVPVIVFPKTMARYDKLLAADAIVIIKGRIDTKEDQVKLIAMEVTRPDLDR